VRSAGACGGVKVRRWVRRSVRYWSHATDRPQTRHVAGPWSQQGLLRASASCTDASRSARWWPRLSGAGCAGTWATWCGDARTRSTPFGEHPGGHVHAERADGDGRRAAPCPRSARSSARDSATRGRGRRCRKFLDRGVKSEHAAVRSRLSRGLLGHEGNSCRPHRHLAPVQRAHRAPDRAFRGGGGLPRRTVRSAQGVQASHERFRCPARDPRERGWQPRAARLPRAYPARTSRSQSGMGGLGLGEQPPGTP